MSYETEGPHLLLHWTSCDTGSAIHALWVEFLICQIENNKRVIWWVIPVIPTFWEARTGGWLEPRSCHCTPVWVTRAKLRLKKKKKEIPVLGRAWWLMPVIPALWESEAGRSPQIESLRHQAGQHEETLSLLKIQKLARHSGWRL